MSGRTPHHRLPAPDLFGAALPVIPARRPQEVPDLRLDDPPRLVAARIAQAPSKEIRQTIWDAVPRNWRDMVAHNVGLILGALIGALETLEQRRAALDAVPGELRPEVELQLRRVFSLRNSKNKA